MSEPSKTTDDPSTDSLDDFPNGSPIVQDVNAPPDQSWCAVIQIPRGRRCSVTVTFPGDTHGYELDVSFFTDGTRVKWFNNTYPENYTYTGDVNPDPPDKTYFIAANFKRTSVGGEPWFLAYPQPSGSNSSQLWNGNFIALNERYLVATVNATVV